MVSKKLSVVPSYHPYHLVLSTESVPGKTCLICSLREEEFRYETPGFSGCLCSFLPEKPHTWSQVVLGSSLAYKEDNLITWESRFTDVVGCPGLRGFLGHGSVSLQRRKVRASPDESVLSLSWKANF